MPSFATYKFVRDRSARALLSPNRASTDALGAITRWSCVEGRSYEIKVDEDEFLIAELAWNDSDASASDDLNSACEKAGVERFFQGKR
jgi:hypothetical protein